MRSGARQLRDHQGYDMFVCIAICVQFMEQDIQLGDSFVVNKATTDYLVIDNVSHNLEENLFIRIQ